MKIPAKGFTHGGKFHADDVFSTALLQILRPDIQVTRGFVVPDDFDGIVYDVGGGMFDHHSEPRECRPNGVPYAAFGLLVTLVWLYLELLRLLALDLRTQIRAADTLDATRIEFGLAQALTAAQEQQPTYLTQLIAAEQAAINHTVARNEKLWDVSLVGGATQVRDRYPGTTGHDTTRSWEGYAGIQVDIPIGDLSRRQAEVRARVAVENQDIRLADPANQPNPCVAPVQTGPFYAVKVIMGDLGTFDGIKTSVVGEAQACWLN